MNLKRILIVDDKEENRYLLRALLQGNGYEIDEAVNGSDGLFAARRHQPALVISDILMPVMDGFTLCREWKKDKELSRIPFIFYTATYTDERDMEFALSLGAEKFIVKPVEPEILMAAISENIGKVGSAPEASAATGADSMKQYNEALIRKLEAKSEQLELVNRVLEKDIEARKKTEEALKESEAKFRNLFDNSPIGKSITNVDGSIRGNRALCGMLGYSEDELKTKKWMDITHPDDIELTQGLMRSLNDGKIAQARFEKRFIHKNGGIVWADMSSYLQKDKDGKPQFFITSITDITERKRIEEKLRQSNELFYLFIKHSPIYAFIKSVSPKESRVLQLSDNFKDITGIEPFEMFGKRMDEIFPPEFAEKITDDDWAVITKGEVVRIDEELNGRSYNTIKFPIMQGENKLLAGYTIDVTERKQLEDDLRINYDRFCKAEAMGHVGNWEFNLQTGQFWGSAEARRIYGFDPKQIDFSTDEVESCIPERERVHQALVDLIEKGKGYDLEFEIHPINASEPKFIASKAELHMDGHGRPLKVMGVIQDITLRKRAEDKIKLFNLELEKRVADRTAQLESANKELEAFSYSVSHDLRAPLRAVDGFVRILQEDYGPSLDAEANRLCSVISESARSMGRLINDLLDFSRIGRAEMRMASVDMTDIARSILHEAITTEMRDKTEFHVDTLPRAFGDPVLLRQVWVNLISNAVKFTSKKEHAVIEIKSEEKGDETIYSIIDNGAGFDMQYVSKLFGVFQRLHSAEEFEGTGVGLAIVQRIIARHGGRAWAEGEIGKGASFHFSLKKRVSDE